MTESDTNQSAEHSINEGSAEQSEHVESPSDSCDPQVMAYLDMFKNRFTETDEGFMKTVNTPLPPPPCVKNWYSKPKRTFDWSRSGNDGQGSSGYRGRGQGQGHWQRGRDNRHHNQGQWNRDNKQNYRDRGHQNEGYDRRQHSHGNQNHGYGQRHDNRSHHSYGGRQDDRQGYNRGDRGRVHYAGMKQHDGRTGRDSGRNYHPYNQNDRH